MLDEQVAYMGQVAPGGFTLPPQIVDELLAGAFHEAEGVEFGSQALRTASGQRVVGGFEELADAPRIVEAAVDVLRPPERRRGALGRGRLHQHVVVGDAVDAPGLGAEAEGLADGGFPDELLVEFADDRARFGVANLEVAAVRNGAAGGVEREQRPAPRLHGLPHAVEGEPWPQVANARAGVAAGEHFHHQVEVFALQVGVGGGADEDAVEGVRGALLGTRAGNDGLRQHVERILQGAQRLDVAFPHRLGEHRGFDEVPRMGGEQGAAAGFADAMPGAPNALHRGGDGRRRLDEHDFVQVADVDAHLQGTGGDDGLEFALLQARFDFAADLARERTVVGVGDRRRFLRVQLQGDLLRHAPAVGEEQRRPVAVDDFVKRLGERFPDLEAVVRGGPRRFREAHAERHALLRFGLDNADRARRAARIAAADVAGHDVQRAHRRRERHALELAGQFRQALQAGHQLDAAPVLHQRVDFVQDDRLHGGQRLSAAHRGEQQIQALRRGDEQFRRAAQHALAVAGFGVAAARLHAEVRKRHGCGGKAFADGGDGFGEVGADVVVERFQGGDVQHPGRAWLGLAGGEGIDGPEKGRQRLAAAGGRCDQQMFAGGDARPASPLHIRRFPESRSEPTGYFGVEDVKRAHARQREWRGFRDRGSKAGANGRPLTRRRS